MNIIDRAKNIITQPKTEWETIRAEDVSAKDTIISYALPLILVGALATVIGIGIVGYSIPFVGQIRSFSWGIHNGLVQLIGGIAGIFISGYVIDMLAPNFQSEKNLNKSIRLVVFAYTPAWVCGVFNVIPALALLGLIGAIYGLVLLYQGMPVMKNTPESQRVSYFVVSLIAIIVVSIVVSLIVSLILAMFFSDPAKISAQEAADALKDVLKQ